MTDKRNDEEREAAPQAGGGKDDVPSPSLPEEGAQGPEAALEEEVALLRAEVSDLSAKWLRALADLDNVRKRVERERCRWADAAREEILLSLLEVVDGFDRAFACGEGDVPPPEDAFRRGVELILAKLREILESNGVRPIETCGAEFDPTYHEAVSMVKRAEHKPNEIVGEERKGYTIGDRVLRCSRVVVAK
jgi:molecular chaperone GrpE